MIEGEIVLVVGFKSLIKAEMIIVKMMMISRLRKPQCYHYNLILTSSL